MNRRDVMSSGMMVNSSQNHSPPRLRMITLGEIISSSEPFTILARGLGSAPGLSALHVIRLQSLQRHNGAIHDHSPFQAEYVGQPH